jgi:hypothetical protein
MSGVSGTVVALIGLLLLRARPLLITQPPARLMAGAAALGAAGLAVVLLAVSRRSRLIPATVAAAAGVFVLVLRFVVFALPDLDPVEQMAGRVLAHRVAAERVASYRVFVRNLVFYTHVKQDDLDNDEHLVAFLDTPDRVLCVLPERELRRLQAAARQPGADRLAAVMSRLRRLESTTYFDAATAKIGALISPDPERDLHTAVLVANR